MTNLLDDQRPVGACHMIARDSDGVGREAPTAVTSGAISRKALETEIIPLGSVVGGLGL